MDNQGQINRRQFIRIGAIGGGFALAAGSAALPAAAAGRGPSVTLTDLGPAVVTFSLAAGVPVGDTIYIASRNIKPMVVIGYHLPTKKVTSVTEAPGISTQTLAADPEGRYLYGCVKDAGGATGVENFFRLDLSKPGAPLEGLHRIPGLDPLAMTTSPDGKIIFTGGQAQPKVYLYDPATNALDIVATPDPTAVWGRSIVASETTIYVGLRGRVPGGSNTRAGLWSIDRGTGESRSIIPEEFTASAEVRDLALLDGKLLAVGATKAGGAFAFIDTVDPSAYTVVQGATSLGKLPRVKGNKIYTAGAGVIEYDMSTGTFRNIELDGIQYGEIWGMFFKGEKLVVVSAFGIVLEIDPATSAAVANDLVAAGAPAGPQLALSIGAADGYVYVGGTNAISRHDVRTREMKTLFLPGEAKDIIVVDGIMHTGQYSGVGLTAYNPRRDGQWPTVQAKLPQNRPHDLHWDRKRKKILIGAQSDTEGVGGFFSFDPATKDLTSAINPFGDGQAVRSVESNGDVVFLGGQNGSVAASVMAWDPVAQRELWRVDPQSKPTGITGLSLNGHHLYASAYGGDFFVIDIRSRKVIHAANHKEQVPDWTTLLTHRGAVYGASSRALYRFDKRTFAIEELVSDLNGEWYGMPRVAVDERGQFYGIKGRNLVRINMRG